MSKRVTIHIGPLSSNETRIAIRRAAKTRGMSITSLSLISLAAYAKELDGIVKKELLGEE